MENYCVICGEIIPEGIMVCPVCEIKYGIRKDESTEMRILLESSSMTLEDKNGRTDKNSRRKINAADSR